MSYGPYAPPQQQYGQQQYAQQPAQQPVQQQYAYQQQPATAYPQQPTATYQPQYRVVEKAEKDISETLTPQLTAIIVIISSVLAYIGVIMAIMLTYSNMNILFHIGKALAATGLLVFSVVLSLLSMQEKLEPRHKATYYAVPVLAIMGMVLLIGA